MWQNWALFYMGLWILASAFVLGGSAKLSNLVFGFLIALLSFWSGMKSRKGGPFSR
ncbi:SPW repeat protein [candidate division TA06 bacterium]|nr:SPW repeat protein [candidate division TA06 bacterium]